MTDQYGRGGHLGRALPATAALLTGLLAGPSVAAAVPLPAPTLTPSTAPAVQTTPRVQATSTLTDTRIVKPAGLTVSSLHRGVVWILSGDRLFAVKTTGRTVGSYTVAGPAPVDLQALAMTKDDRGHPVLLLGDIGDPHRTRSKGIWLYTMREPDRLGNGTLRPQRYRLEYPDGPQNSRTLLVRPSDQRVYVVSMSAGGGNVYALPAALGLGMTNVLTKVNPLHFVPQDGGFLPDGRVILRGKYQAHVLDGVGGRRLAYLQLPREAADGPMAVAEGGAALLVAGMAGKARLWHLRMPALPPGSSTPGRSAGPTAGPAPVASTGPLSGRAVGMASLAGLFAIAVLGGILHLRRRSDGRGA